MDTIVGFVWKAGVRIPEHTPRENKSFPLGVWSVYGRPEGEATFYILFLILEI